jgi:hypothetical protein
MPDKYNLKYVFSNDQFYDPLLFFSGWHHIQRLENGIAVWEREDVPPLPAILPRREIPFWQRLLWGLLPMSVILLSFPAIALTTLRPGKPTRYPACILRWYAAIDRRLRTWSELPASDESAPAIWQPWLIWRNRLTLPQPAPPSARRVRTLLLASIGLISATTGIFWYLEQIRSPIAQLEAYYDDLDFQRFDIAYARLDPETRPSFDQYVLERSVRGGLVASYGKLDSVQATLISRDPGRVTLETSIIWITALAEYPQHRLHTLVERNGVWYIQPDPADPVTPPDTFIRRATVEWVAQGRRRVTTGPTDTADLLDRPQLQVLDARLVRSQDRYTLIGEVRNIDTNPADTTVTGILYDEQGRELTRYNAQTAILHKLLPGESTPFRVDFEGVAGALLTDTLTRDFQPDDFTPPNLFSPAADFSVAARAVVTGRDLDRTLTSQDLRVAIGVTGTLTLTGNLLNIGAAEATVPHILVTLYDQRGRVAWVESEFLEQSVRPQRSIPFSIVLPPRTGIRTLLENSDISGSALDLLAARNDLLNLPPESGYAALRISVHALEGGAP